MATRYRSKAVVVEGLVDGRPVEAFWTDGMLFADDELLTRAQIVVDLSESWRTEDGRIVAADLSGPPLAVALTLIRAMSVVRRVSLPA
jgi:hypothetical protein